MENTPLDTSTAESAAKNLIFGELGQALKYLLARGDDEKAACMAEALTRHASDQTRHLEEDLMLTLRIEVPTQLLLMMDNDRVRSKEVVEFPKTRAVLWQYLLDQWLMCPSDRNKRLGRFIAWDKGDWTEQERKLMLARLRDRLRDIEKSAHAAEMVALVLSDCEPEKDDPEVLRTFGRSLGHFASPQQLKVMANCLTLRTE